MQQKLGNTRMPSLQSKFYIMKQKLKPKLKNENITKNYTNEKQQTRKLTPIMKVSFIAAEKIITKDEVTTF